MFAGYFKTAIENVSTAYLRILLLCPPDLTPWQCSKKTYCMMNFRGFLPSPSVRTNEACNTEPWVWHLWSGVVILAALARLGTKAGNPDWELRLATQAGNLGWERRLATQAGNWGWELRLLIGHATESCSEILTCLNPGPGLATSVALVQRWKWSIYLFIFCLPHTVCWRSMPMKSMTSLPRPNKQVEAALTVVSVYWRLSWSAWPPCLCSFCCWLHSCVTEATRSK